MLKKHAIYLFYPIFRAEPVEMTYQRPHIVLDRDTEKVVGLIIAFPLAHLHTGGWGEPEQAPHGLHIHESVVIGFYIFFNSQFTQKKLDALSKWKYLLYNVQNK